MLHFQKDQKVGRKSSFKSQPSNQHTYTRSSISSNNNNITEEEKNIMADEDEVVKQLMSILGNKKQLKIRSTDGKIMKLSVDFIPDVEQCSSDTNLQIQLNNINIEKGMAIPHLQEESEALQNFDKLMQASCENSSISQIPPIKSTQQIKIPSTAKKVSLNAKKNKLKSTNQAVLQFIDTNSVKTTENSLITTCQTIPKKQQKIITKDATRSIQFLKQNHPQDQQHLQIISQRMIELQKMQQDKLKLDQEISSILSASFSNSISGIRFDNSIDASIFSLSALSINGANDPLCQIFNNYLRKTAINKKSSSQKMPSFLFLYSQPMLDPKGYEINDQINYFEEESIIQKTLKDCKCKIDYIKEQGTVQKFNYWITQNISIIHFCGHGVPDYLLFEGQAGQSVKLDSQKLQKILKQLKSPLQLVFVASCHSESTGQIFKNAGAVHVICIKDNYQILDQACHEFARIFYHSCINDKMTICQAFTFAKKQIVLSGKFTSHECSKFIIIRNHCDGSCTSKLDIAKQGQFRDLTFKPYYCKFIPSRVQNFIPRPRDLHQILELINNKNRFISLIGHSGIGKSTLVRELVRYIQFRNIFKDGVIYLDIRSCEKILKIFQVFTMQLFQSFPGKLSKTFGENAQKIIKQLYQREVLIVMDNCQNIMLSDDKNQFKKLIEVIMKNCDNVYFVFTNRAGIGRQIDYCSQKLYELGKLTESQAQHLFFLRVPRKIENAQLQQFLKVANVTHFSQHPFFQFLNGHPQAICMTASLLSQRSLSELYELLMKPSLKNIFPKEKIDDENLGVNPLVQTAMKISLNVMKNKYKESSQMIKTLSLLPVGVDSETMARLFGSKWRTASQRLQEHSLIHCREMNGTKYYSVHPYLIIYIQSEINHDQKLKIHEKICQEFSKRIQFVYKNIGTLSIKSQKFQEQFFIQQENYKAIILRELSFYGEKSKIKKLYYNLFQADYSDDEMMDKQQEQLNVKIKTQAIDGINKKRVYNEKILQPTKKDAITLMLVEYVTILFVTKNPTCLQELECGILLSRMKNKLISEANLLRIKACIFLIKNKYIDAKDSFLKSWQLYAIEGCGLGAASCEAAVGYIRLIQQEYAPAKKNMENALKYYDQIAHPFGKHYLNRWLCNLKTKMNRTEKQLISHRQQAQKLLKQTKSSLRSNNINNTSLIKHKLGTFVFRFTFDNISLFLETSFEVDVKPRIINEVALKKTEANQDQILVSLNKNQPVKKNVEKRGR